MFKIPEEGSGEWANRKIQISDSEKHPIYYESSRLVDDLRRAMILSRIEAKRASEVISYKPLLREVKKKIGNRLSARKNRADYRIA